MLISRRLEEQLVCFRGNHSFRRADLIILDPKYHQKRYKCNSCFDSMKTAAIGIQCKATINQIQAIQDQLYLRVSQNVFEYVQQLEFFLKNNISNLNEKEAIEAKNLIKQWIINLIDISEDYSIYSFYNEAEELCKCIWLLLNEDKSVDMYFEKKRARLIQIINDCNSFYYSKLSSLINRNQQLSSDFQKKACLCFENLKCYSQKKVSSLRQKRNDYLLQKRFYPQQTLEEIIIIYKDNFQKMIQMLGKSHFNFILDHQEQQLTLNNFKIVYSDQYLQIILAQQKVRIQQSQKKIQQLKGCLAISFNYDDTLMAAGCENDIRLYRFENGLLLDSIVDLQGHNDFVYCLTFSHQYNWLASGGKDGQLILWKQISQFNWIQTNKNIEHPILCLIMNNNEEQLISGNQNGQIHIWQIQYVQNFFKIQQIISMNQTSILSISINEQGTQFVMCTLNNQIILFQNMQENQWVEIQRLENNENDIGLRVIFLNQSTIILQQFKNSNLLFYNQNGHNFQKNFQMKLEGNRDINLNPIIWNKQTQTLIVKQTNYVYFINIQEESYILQENRISFHNYRFFGTVSQGGKYIVLWEIESRKFKVYEINYQMI